MAVKKRPKTLSFLQPNDKPFRQPALLWTADLHLKDRIWADRPIFGDAYWAWEFIREQADKHRVPIVNGGDAFDTTTPSTRSLMEFAKATAWSIDGNHDKVSPSWMEVLAKGKHRLGGKRVQLGGLNIFGLNFCRADEWKESLKEIKATDDVLVCHQAFKELMGGNSYASLSEIPFVRMVLAGDYHQFKVLPFTNATGGSAVAVSPGPPCRQSIGEEDDKRCVLLYDDLTFDEIPVPGRPVIRLGTISIFDRMQRELASLPAQIRREFTAAMEQGVPAEVAKPIVHVRYWDGLENFESRFEAACGDDAFLFSYPVKEAADMSTYQPPDQQVAGKLSLVGVAEERFGVDSHALSLVSRLNQTGGDREQIAAILRDDLGRFREQLSQETL